MSADFGLVVTDLTTGNGFHEADFSATLDGRSYSGAMRGMHMVDPPPPQPEQEHMEMDGNFYDSDPDILEGRYHMLIRLIPETAIEFGRIEITWKDGQQCYCELNVDSGDFSMAVEEVVAADRESIAFDFDGDSTGHYDGKFDGFAAGWAGESGCATVWEGQGGEAWHEKGLVSLLFWDDTDTGWGALKAYARMLSYVEDPPVLEMELSFLGAIIKAPAWDDLAGFDGSVNGGNLYLNITDPVTPGGSGSGSFDVRHTHSEPCEVDGEGCFIATAAYGTSTAEEIDTLRVFRDEVLLQNSLGSQLVALYYEVSPPVADFISEHDVLRTLVRELLVDPVAWVVDAIGSLWRN